MRREINYLILQTVPWLNITITFFRKFVNMAFQELKSLSDSTDYSRKSTIYMEPYTSTSHSPKDKLHAAVVTLLDFSSRLCEA
jgi:hypothetical protein